MTSIQPQPWGTSSLTTEPTLVDVPEYGSPAWHALPEDDPARMAAVIRAAECWRAWTDPAATEQRIQLELQVIADSDAGVDPDAVEIAARLEAEVRETTHAVTRRMLHKPVHATAPKPVVQTDDWPTVAIPGNHVTPLPYVELEVGDYPAPIGPEPGPRNTLTVTVVEPLTGIPSPAEMLRRLTATA